MRNGESIVYNTIDIRLELLSESKSTEDTLTSTSTEEDKEPKEPEPNSNLFLLNCYQRR